MKHFAVFAAASAVLPYVVAHGFVSQVVIDGQTYEGNVPNQYKGACQRGSPPDAVEPNVETGPSPIRLISDISPVKGASNKDLFCGLNAALAEMVVPANPGSNVTFQWSGGAGQKWPHNTGPLMTYLASCGSTSCDKFDSLDAQWFKIDEAGKKDADTWIQQDISESSCLVPFPRILFARCLLHTPVHRRVTARIVGWFDTTQLKCPGSLLTRHALRNHTGLGVGSVPAFALWQRSAVGVARVFVVGLCRLLRRRS